MPATPTALSRRAVLAGGLILPLTPRLAFAAPAPLAFAVFRNGAKIGEHRMVFTTGDDTLTATAEAVMTVKLGPVPVFRYRHHAVETRVNGAFASLQTTTNSNGKAEHVSAEKVGDGVRIETASGAITAPAGADPMTHWNSKVFSGPLFNPQTGRMLKITTSRIGPGHWAIRGEAEIDDFYDGGGAWSGLKGKLQDGSSVEYRRI